MKNVIMGLLLAQAAIVGGTALAAGQEGARSGTSVDASYRAQLLALAEADQKIREQMRGAFTVQQLQANQGAAKDMVKRMVASQKQNQQALAALIERHGFPDIARAGEDGAHAGFLVAQHATDLAFRERFLQQMEQAAAQGHYDRSDLALFVDRNLVMSGKPQRYGTQHKADGSLFEVEDPGRLEQRRAEAGLPKDAAPGGS